MIKMFAKKEQPITRTVDDFVIQATKGLTKDQLSNLPVLQEEFNSFNLKNLTSRFQMSSGGTAGSAVHNLGEEVFPKDLARVTGAYVMNEELYTDLARREHANLITRRIL
jgi:hypothetical protein